MKITAIIPAYNASKYIRKCLDSLVNLVDEIVVINDGSTDNTLSILKSYKNINVYTIQNHGVSYSRNYGIKKATGDYLMFVDADDYLVDDLKQIISSIKFKGEDVIFFNKDINPKLRREEILEHIVGYNDPCIAGPFCKLFNKKFIYDNSIQFNEKIINGEDMLFNLECALKMKKYAIVNKSIYMYRVVLSSATKKFDTKIIQSDISFQSYINDIFANSLVKNSKQLIDYCKINAIVTIADRCSYLKKYSEFKSNILIFEKSPYSEFMNLKTDKLSRKRKILFYLIKNKKYRIVYYLLNLNHKKYKKEKEIFVEI